MSLNDNISNFQVSTPSATDLLKMSKAMMAGESHIIYSTLTIDGKEILSDSNFDVSIRQKMGTHDQFEISCPTEALEGYGGYPLSQTRNYLGKNITIELKQFMKSAMVYEGKISGLRHKKFDGYEGHIIISGSAPTILLENGPDCQSFEDKSLRAIFEKVFQGYPQDSINMNGIPSGLPSLNERIPFTVQYKESDFAFLNRMANRFGEWFYYNGQQIVLGSAGGKIVDLVEEQGLYEFELSMKIAPQKFSYSSYGEKSGSGHLVNSASENLQDGVNPFQNFAVAISENIYGKMPLNHINQSLDSNEFELRNLAKRQKVARQNLVVLEGRSNDPNLALGDRAKITAYMPDNKLAVNGEVPVESYKVIEISHHYDGLDGYYNTFTGIPYASISHLTDEEATPIGEQQSAVVVDNNDPNGLGRVRVQFEWQKRNSQKTPWIRMVQGHAGSGKGSYFIPEIGEEVLVGFEAGNAEKPVVLGTQYNGKEVSWFHTAGNDQKVIQTRSGTKIVMNDAVGSVFIEDPSGNSIFLDGQGNIKVDAPKRLILNATDIEINAYNNLEINVGNNMIMNVMTKLFVFTPQLQQIVSGFMNLFSGKALINSNDIIDIEAKEISAIGTKKMFIHSDEITTINSKGVAEMHGNSGNKLTNQAKSVVIAPPESIANVIVEFRPISTYNGEFGFDWLRIDDNGLATESAYETIIESGFEAPNGVAPRRDANTQFELGEAFLKLEKEYNPIVVSRPSGLPIKYYVPWLNLYPESVSLATTTPVGLPKPPFEADLMILIDIEGPDEPDQIRVVFDKRYFTINGKDGTDANAVLLTEKTIGPKRQATATLKIKCINQFRANQNIMVYAYPKGSLALSPAVQLTKRKLAGKITVCANMKDAAKGISQRKTQNFLTINVITNIQGTPSIGLPNPTEKENLQNALHQALIHGFIKEYSDNGGFLDLTSVNEFKILTDASGRKTYGKYIYEKLVKDPVLYPREIAAGTIPPSTDGLLYEDYPGKGMFIFLKERFLAQPGNRVKYAGHFLVFIFNERPYDYYAFPGGGYTTTTGQVQDIGVKTVCLFDAALRGDYTLHHEALHGLGLDHTHDDGQFLLSRKYTFQRHETTNIMSYGDPPLHPDNTKITTWHWQWKILKSNAR